MVRNSRNQIRIPGIYFLRVNWFKTFGQVVFRQCFEPVEKVKSESYAISRPRGTTLEDWIKQFLEEEVKPIWPAGWMTLKNLEKAVKTAQSASVAKESNGVANGTATAPKTTKKNPK